MDPAIGEPEVVLVEGGRILAAGTRDLLDAHPEASPHDLGGRTLVPGFIDAHNHLSVAALHPIWADLSSASDVEGALQLVRAQAAAEPETAWIRGAGWELSAPLPLTRHDLDALNLDRPIIVAHFSLHQCVVCSRGLDQLGIGRATPDPQGGMIRRWAELFAARGRRLWRDGITAVHDAACSPEAEAVYRTLAAAGALPISVLVMPHAAAILSGPDDARLAGPPTGEGDEWLRVGPAKLFADGGPGLACDVTIEGKRFEYGLLFDGVAPDAQRLAERGFGVAVHAMGNVGLQATLDAFAGLRRGGPGAHLPLRVEHATLAAPDQIRTLQELGVTAVVQPGFVNLLGPVVGSIQPDVERWMPFRDLADAGVQLAASSDDPCPRLHHRCGPRGRPGG
jgi:predicted amidohydrolase YtcJ